MKVILAGGGTGGPTTPLVAIYQELKKQYPDTDFLFLGSKKGPEKNICQNYGIPFKKIVSGKWRRYFSLMNLIDLFKIAFAYFQSRSVLKKFQADIILTAGSFVAVPVAWAAGSLKIPYVVHQQDIVVGLANKLMIKKASKITVCFEPSLKDFNKEKVVLTGNPIREELFQSSKEKFYQEYGFNPNFPTLYIVGGGTGAAKINGMILELLGELTKVCQIIHSCGKDKMIQLDDIKNNYAHKDEKRILERYKCFEFIDNKNLKDVLAAADVIISRAGMSSLSEFSSLGKAVILLPLPGHQEKNAEFFNRMNSVKVILDKDLNLENFRYTILNLLQNPGQIQGLGRNIKDINPPDAALKYVKVIKEVLDIY